MTIRTRLRSHGTTGRLTILPWLPLLLVAALSTGCGSDATAPGITRQLAGHVVDRAGRPVVGASIALVYTLEPAPPASVTHGPARFSAGSPSLLSMVVLRLEVFDYLGRRVRRLIDNPSGAVIANQSETWAGDDDHGNPVPNGLYTVHMEARERAGGDKQVTVIQLMVLYFAPQDLLAHRHTLTEMDGSYTIPLALLPVGERLSNASPGNPDPVGPRVVSPLVHVYALRRVGTTIESVEQDMVITNRNSSLTVDLTLP